MHMRPDGTQGRRVFAASFALALLQKLASKNIVDTLLQFQLFLLRKYFCAFALDSKSGQELFN